MNMKFSPDTGILTTTNAASVTGKFAYNPITGDRLPQAGQAAPEGDDFRSAGDVWKFDPWTGSRRHAAVIYFDPQGWQLSAQTSDFDTQGAPLSRQLSAFDTQSEQPEPSGYTAPRDVPDVTLGRKIAKGPGPASVEYEQRKQNVMPDLRTRSTAAYYLRLAEQTQRERGRTYDPSRNGGRSATQVSVAFEAVTGKTLTAGEVFLLLQLVKDVRNWNAIKATGHPHEDSSVDAVSYAALKAEALADGSRDA